MIGASIILLLATLGVGLWFGHKQLNTNDGLGQLVLGLLLCGLIITDACWIIHLLSLFLTP